MLIYIYIYMYMHTPSQINEVCSDVSPSNRRNGVAMAPGGQCAAVLVTGGGSEDVNGLYVPTGRSWHDAEVFENDRHCMLSREPHKSQRTGLTSFGWILGQDRKPMYAVQSEETLPPKSGWKKFTGQGPIPAVDLSYSLESAAEAAALALKEQGNAFFSARSYKEAVGNWSRALSTLEKYANEDSPIKATLYANRAEARIRLERWEEALLDCEAALAHKPTHDKALLRAAVALRGLKRYQDAMAMVQRCLDIDPGHFEAKRLLQDIDQLVEAEQRQLHSKTRASREKPAEAATKLRGDADLSSIPRAFDAKDINNKNGFQAFEGYSQMRESSGERLPISELPYHKMGLPQEQLDLMDNFFKELRANKKQQALSQKKEMAEYELVKNEYRERALEDEALGKENPMKMLQSAKAEEPKALKDDDLPSLVLTAPKKVSADKEILSSEDKKEIDELFINFKPKSSSERRSRLQQIIHEEEEDAKGAESRTLQELCRLKNTRRGEPTRFEQAAGELYCWWSLPPGIVAKDIRVQTSNGGESLCVQVRDVLIFDRQLFHPIKGDDIIWSLDAGELSLTLTKRERSKLWDQLGVVSEMQRDAQGRVIESTIPEPMSINDRLDKFRQMVTGDDGQQPRYEELDDRSKQLVDAMRRFEHARATGDQNALSLAEHDLEELGRVVV